MESKENKNSEKKRKRRKERKIQKYIKKEGLAVADIMKIGLELRGAHRICPCFLGSR